MSIFEGILLRELQGVVLIGITEKGDVGDGAWRRISRSGAGAIDVSVVGHPEEYRPRQELLLSNDAEDPRPPCDLRIAVKRAAIGPEVGNAVAAFEKGAVYVSGDEAFFIRFTEDVLRIVDVVVSQTL